MLLRLVGRTGHGGRGSGKKRDGNEDRTKKGAHDYLLLEGAGPGRGPAFWHARCGGSCFKNPLRHCLPWLPASRDGGFSDAHSKFRRFPNMGMPRQRFNPFTLISIFKKRE
jgi:hypothetical protein